MSPEQQLDLLEHHQQLVLSILRSAIDDMDLNHAFIAHVSLEKQQEVRDAVRDFYNKISEFDAFMCAMAFAQVIAAGKVIEAATIRLAQ